MNSLTDLFHLIATNVWLYGGTFIIVLSILVFVHEWGHYIVARMCGVKVETFSIGFGKEIYGFNDRHGTRWKISLIPLGGFVKMFGDTDPASARHLNGIEEDDGRIRSLTQEERSVAFYTKPVAQRAAIVFAGPAINFIFALILLSGLYIFVGQPVTPPLAGAIMEGSAAEKAGFIPHDEVVTINGKKIYGFDDIRREVMIALDTPMEFGVMRDGQLITLTATPERVEDEDHFGFKHSRGQLGILGPNNGIAMKQIKAVNGTEYENPDDARAAVQELLDTTFQITLDRGTKLEELTVKPLRALNEGLAKADSETFNVLLMSSRAGEDLIKKTPVAGLMEAVRQTYDISVGTLRAMWQMITGTRSATELGGIIRIGAIAGDMAQMGLIALISFTALLSINLGLVNLFPIPMLDGGHLLFYFIEAVKGSPIPDQIQEYAFRLGLAILVGIMLFANLNDIVQLVL